MGFIVQPQTFLSIGPSRSFGTANQIFSGYVTVTENTSDEIEITQQPVQQGASITDHAFKKPVTLGIQIRFSSSPLPSFSLTNGVSAPQSLQKIYSSLIQLQNSFQPFTVTTPKRTYINMLFKALGVTTDKSTENILSVNCSFQQIILIPLVVTQLSAAQLKTPKNTQPTNSVGQKQSALAAIAGAVKGFFGGSTVGGL